MDGSRVYLFGQSQGGHAAWDLASAHPERFAAVAPYIGCLASDHLDLNLGATALYCVDGDQDGNAPARNRKVFDRKALQAGLPGLLRIAKISGDRQHLVAQPIELP